VQVLVLLQQYQKSVGIGIGNTFFKVYWYWYCQYFLKVLLTTLVGIGLKELVVSCRNV